MEFSSQAQEGENRKWQTLRTSGHSQSHFTTARFTAARELEHDAQNRLNGQRGLLLAKQMNSGRRGPMKKIRRRGQVALPGPTW